jgi:hypothetical protein
MQAQTQRAIDVVSARTAQLHEAVRAAQVVFTMVRSQMPTEQRLELLERVALLQSEAIFAALAVLLEHEGALAGHDEALDDIRNIAPLDPELGPVPLDGVDAEIA